MITEWGTFVGGLILGLVGGMVFMLAYIAYKQNKKTKDK